MFKVYDGTPKHGGKGLCHSCRYSHVYRGTAESNVHVICKANEIKPFEVEEPVADCSEYLCKTSKALWEMERIAWVLATKNGKTIGFISAREARKKQDADEIDIPDF